MRRALALLRMKYYIIISLFFLFSCKEEKKQIASQQTIVIPDLIVSVNDSLLSFNNGYWFYKSKLFSGTKHNYYPNHQLQSSQSFYNGKEEGWLQTFDANGKKESKRYFHLGEKDSINCGWWNNGNLRFKYNFKNGNYDGSCKEWYASGKPLKEILYDNGKDISGKGWRENGKLFMSFVNKDGRRYGLLNAQLCYSLKNERGEYVKSVVDSTR
jgi:antitoxin component YwqK of YwqJK toxin-antitoxin module